MMKWLLEATPMAHELVSIVIPTYNRVHLLGRALASALAQTYRDFEIIIVDDGSTDSTKDFLAPYIAANKIRYHYQPNAGHAAAKNTGVNLARGTSVAFLDSDDEWLPEKLEAQISLLHQNPRTILVYTNIRYWNERGENLGTLFEHTHPYRGKVVVPLFEDNFIALSSVMVKKKHIIKAGGFDEKNHISDDYDLWLRLSVDYEFDYLETPMVNYLRHAHNISNDQHKNNRYLIRVCRRVLGNPRIRRTVGARVIVRKMLHLYRRRAKLLMKTKLHGNP